MKLIISYEEGVDESEFDESQYDFIRIVHSGTVDTYRDYSDRPITVRKEKNGGEVMVSVMLRHADSEEGRGLMKRGGAVARLREIFDEILEEL